MIIFLAVVYKENWNAITSLWAHSQENMKYVYSYSALHSIRVTLNPDWTL